MISHALLASLTAATIGVASIASATSAPTAAAQSKLQTKVIRYEQGGVTFESTIVYQGAPEERAPEKRRPGILMVPNWMGPSKASLAKAEQLAGDRYIVMMVDMYGIEVRPTNGEQAGAAATAVRADRELMRARAIKALQVFRTEGAPLGLDADRIAAAGFCFGGGTVLELGRAGADLAAIVSFHGDLLSPTLEKDANKTKAKVLVLHGADDPYVPQKDVEKFIDTMRHTDVDWQLVQYSATVHSFTDPTASADGARYHERSAKRAFAAMEQLLRSVWPD